MHENESNILTATTAASMAAIASMGKSLSDTIPEKPEPNMCYGIDLNKYSGAVTEDDAKEYHEQIYSLTKIELIRGMKKLVSLEKNLYMIRGLLNMATSNEAMIRSFVDSVDGVVNHLKDDDTVQSAAPESDEPLDPEATAKQLDTYEQQLEAMVDMMHIRYEEIKSAGNTTVAEDITETLLKNKSTLENVENPNASMYIKYIDTVVDELQSHSIKRILNKVSVPKRTRVILTDFTRDVERSFKEILNCGFSPAWLSTMADFMWEEQAFACDDKTAMSRNEFATWAIVFMYHVSQIVNSEVKKHNYLSLVYKYYVLQMLEMQNTTKMDEDQRVDENDVENEASKLRQSMYREYRQLFDAYVAADEVAHGAIKNNLGKIKDVMLQIMNPPRHRRDEPKTDVETNLKPAPSAE